MNQQVAAQAYRVMLPALCWNRQRPDFYAVTEDVSSEGIRLRSATVPARGERLSCSVRYLGLIETEVVNEQANAFVVRPLASGKQKSAIVGELLRFGRQQDGSLERQRVHPRIVPRQTDTWLTLPSGTSLPATIVDISASGVALRVDAEIDIGTAVMIGKTHATLVRAFPNGFGAVFPVPLDPALVGPNTRL